MALFPQGGHLSLKRLLHRRRATKCYIKRARAPAICNYRAVRARLLREENTRVDLLLKKNPLVCVCVCVHLQVRKLVFSRHCSLSFITITHLSLCVGEMCSNASALKCFNVTSGGVQSKAVKEHLSERKAKVSGSKQDTSTARVMASISFVVKRAEQDILQSIAQG